MSKAISEAVAKRNAALHRSHELIQGIIQRARTGILDNSELIDANVAQRLRDTHGAALGIAGTLVAVEYGSTPMAQELFNQAILDIATILDANVVEIDTYDLGQLLRDLSELRG